MSTTSNFHPTYATVDLTALAHNLSQLRRILSPSCDIMPVVKANAYGHGVIQTAQTLIQHGINRLAVFSTTEGVVLRQAGITIPVVILGPVFPEQIDTLFSYRLTPVISDCLTLEAIAQRAASQAIPYPIHLKVETGMGRLGLTERELKSVINSQKFPSSLQLEGLMSHLADSDGPDLIATEEQIGRFNRAIKVVVDGGVHVPLIHLANSGGAIRVASSHFTLVRPGIMLYGYHTLPNTVPAPNLQPVLSLKTHIAQLRTIQPGGTVSYNQTFTAQRLTQIAILPIGYADGLSRRLSNRGQVLIRGQRVPIVGLVCMDMVMVDVTTIPGTSIGEEVVLIGQQGNERITAGEIAEWAGTISYEVLCAISSKIPRLYHPS